MDNFPPNQVILKALKRQGPEGYDAIFTFLEEIKDDYSGDMQLEAGLYILLDEIKRAQPHLNF